MVLAPERSQLTVSCRFNRVGNAKMALVCAEWFAVVKDFRMLCKLAYESIIEPMLNGRDIDLQWDGGSKRSWVQCLRGQWYVDPADEVTSSEEDDDEDVEDDDKDGDAMEVDNA